jgi:hypothetical protein
MSCALAAVIGLVILVVLLASYAAALVGLFLTAGGWATGPGITGLSAQTFVDNLLPDFTDGWHFNTAVTYLLCVGATGCSWREAFLREWRMK